MTLKKAEPKPKKEEEKKPEAPALKPTPKVQKDAEPESKESVQLKPVPKKEVRLFTSKPKICHWKEYLTSSLQDQEIILQTSCRKLQLKIFSQVKQSTKPSSPNEDTTLNQTLKSSAEHQSKAIKFSS